MSFNSISFIVFYGLVLLVCNTRAGWNIKKIFLLAASWIFYAAWNPPFIVLLWISTLTDWFVGKWMFQEQVTAVRRLLLLISLMTNLGLLAYFKYANFILETLETWFVPIGSVSSTPLDIILPVGISFYTFQTLSYTIDIYKRNIQPAESFLDYCLYVSFFPQLVAGPIVRAKEFLPQLAAEPKVTWQMFDWGLCLLVFGLFQKVVLADRIFAPIAGQLFESATSPDALSAWVGSLAFAGQILCDFAGYSSCAIGVALCIGFRLPENFNYPYAATSFSGFWRRWHISLSTWLRDYVYISMGGNRIGRLHTYRNLIATMLLGGLWHGASWTFVLWGALHGAFLIAERFVRNVLPTARSSVEKRVRSIFGWGVTFWGVLIAWVVFRADSLQQVQSICLAMIGVDQGDALISLGQAMLPMTAIAAILLVSIVFRERSFRDAFMRTPDAFRAAVLSVMLFLITTCPASDQSFIYFQF